MSETEQTRAPKAQVFENGRTWSVWLSPDATVVELAVIMAGLRAEGINIQADHMGHGAFALFPMIPGTPPPTAVMLARIMSDPLPERLPALIAKYRSEEARAVAR